MQEHGEHQSLITTKHMYNSLQNTALLIFIFVINVPPIAALIFTDEEVKMWNDDYYYFLTQDGRWVHSQAESQLITRVILIWDNMTASACVPSWRDYSQLTETWWPKDY